MHPSALLIPGLIPGPVPRTARAVRGAFGLAVAFLLSLAISSSAAAAQPQAPFFDSVDVPVVEVDVAVTDRKGRAATHLQREDFELYVDGERVEITNFSRPPTRRAIQSGATSPAAPHLSQGGQKQSRDPGSGPLTVVIYLDELNLHPPHRARIATRLRAALETLRGTRTRFLLATMRDRLEVVTAPTTDVGAILEAMAARPKADPRAIAGFFARRRALQEVRSAAMIQGPLACTGGAMLAAARQHAHEQARRAAIAADGLADLVTTLSGVPGHKALVYISDGLPQRPGISVFDFIAQEMCQGDSRTMSEAFGAMLEFDESRRLQRIAAHANANRVTFFPLDAAGVRPGLAQSLALDAPPSPTNDSLHRMNVQGGLHVLADESGGKLLANSNDLAELLDDVSVQLAATYSLGFDPAESKPGEVRTIDILLAPNAKKGLRVRHRASYRFKTQDERLAERLLSVAYLGSRENPLNLTVGFQAEDLSESNVHDLIVEVGVPRTHLEELSGGAAGPDRRLRLWLLAANRKSGARTPVRQKLLPVGDTAGIGSADSASFNFQVAMELPEGQYHVAVGIRDELTGIVSFVRKPVTLPIGAMTSNDR